MFLKNGLCTALVSLVALLVLSACGGGGGSGGIGAIPAYFHTSLSGMMQDAEPDEGAIPATGRTYRGSLKPLNQEPVAGVQFLLGNLTATQIRGARMLMGVASVPNSEQLPTKNGNPSNLVTGDPHTGWVRVKIGGADDLPVSASQDGASGAGLSWTDLVAFTQNFKPGDGEIVWRIWVPNRATAPYARTFSSATMYGELSALRSLGMFQIAVLGSDQYQNGSWMYYGYTDSDVVGNPALAVTWKATPTPPGHFDAYSKDYVTAIPILGFRWKATRSLPVIEMVGDSIMQGYGDHAQIVNVDGVPGRLIRALGSGNNAPFTFVNFGQSGWTPEQYLARWKGLARADPSGATAMVYSIYSPNGFAGGDFGHQNQARIDALKTNCLAAEKAAHDFGRIFIPAFITGTNIFLLNPKVGVDGVSTGDGYAVDNTGLVKDLLDWAKTRYGSQLLDLHDAVQSKYTIGPAMQSVPMVGEVAYTDDQTHPNTAGYDALGTKAVAIFPAVYAAARAAQLKP